MTASGTPVHQPTAIRATCLMVALMAVLLAGSVAAAAAEAPPTDVLPGRSDLPAGTLRLAQLAVEDDDSDDDADDDLASDAADPGAADDDDDGDDIGDDGDDDDDDGRADPRERLDDGLERDRDRDVPGATGAARDAGDSASLGDDEVYDDSGYVARRGQLLALNPQPSTLSVAQASGYGIAERYRLDSLDLTVVRISIPEDQDVGAAIRTLRGRDPGATFEYEHLYDFSPSGPYDVERAAGQPPQPRSSLSGRDDLRIGLIDTAVAPASPSIAGARIEQRPFISTGDPPTVDHGTAVASILAHQRDGLLPRSQLYVASIFQQSANGDSIGAATDLARAIDWLIARGTPVINMSLAGPPNAILEAAVRRAIDRGHIVVAAVGNAGPAARPQYPAAYPGVVGVTAIDARGKVYRRAGRGPQVDFAAPGVAVAAARPSGGDEPVSGTSFAAPYVTAVLALRHTRPDPVAARRVVTDLSRETVDLGDAGQDGTYGYGAVPLRPPVR